MILLHDNFRSYPTADDMLVDGGKGGPWTTFIRSLSVSQHSLIDNPTWKNDGSTLRALLNSHSHDQFAPQRDFSATAQKAVCVQFIVGGIREGTPDRSESCNIVLFQEPVLDTSTVSSSWLSSFYGVSLRSISSTIGATGNVGVYYTIPTTTTGQVNQLLIGTLRPWGKASHYRVDMKIDHTNPVARIIIYVNGVLELDTTYDRDRINNGMQTLDFKRVLLGGGSDGTSSSSQRGPRYSNLVVYTDDAQTPFPPPRPIALDTVSVPLGQGYDGLRPAPNADDSTYATVVPGAVLNGVFDDLPANPNPVLAADLIVRHKSVAGIEPSQITTSARRADGSVAGSVLTTAAPGLPPVLGRTRLPAGTTAADVNGMTFRIQAAG